MSERPSDISCLNGLLRSEDLDPEGKEEASERPEAARPPTGEDMAQGHNESPVWSLCI